MPTHILENYHKILQFINDTAHKCGRDPKEITLVTVTKGHSWLEALPLFNAGVRDFGESRLQEALPKMAESPIDTRWHLIGTLQANKVRKAINKFVMIHSVDTPDLAKKISQHSLEAGIVTSILLQVNTSGEPTKHGLDVESWRAAFQTVQNLPGISLGGFMTMAPLIEDEKVIRTCFARLRHFRDELVRESKVPLPHLSMGMSHDYRLAIAEGATLLRIGTAIFSG